MALVMLQPDQLKRLIRRRRITGADRFDEVWDGVYVMSPLANIEHQELATNLACAIMFAMGGPGLVRSIAGINVSDRVDDWTKNYRCPDVAVILADNPGQDRGAYWLGGPDLAVEILSKDDRAREKFDFYAKVGVRELLLIDRDPWRLELYRLEGLEYATTGTSDAEHSAVLPSSVMPLTFRLLPADKRPMVEVARVDGTQQWLA